MYEPLFEQLGFTKNESAVYLALLKLGKSKSGAIVHEAKVSGGKIYETLAKLIDKGIVKTVIENGVKQFIANDPETLLVHLAEKEKFLNEQKTELIKVLPSLQSLKRFEADTEMVSMIKGMRGVTALVYRSLEAAKRIRIMGVRSSKNETFNRFWMHWHERRVQIKKNARVIFSDKNTAYWNFFKKLKYTEIKELFPLSPSAIMIIDSEVFIFSYERELTCIHIVANSIATSFSNFFDDLWKMA